LLNGIPTESTTRVEKVFDIAADIKHGVFSQAGIDTAVCQMKNGKAPGLPFDGLPLEFWKLSKVKKYLLKFCSIIYIRNRPKEWGISCLTLIPKKEV